MKKYALAVVIGRFQPVHNGHVALINEAKKVANEVLVLVGSSGQPRSYENPFDFGFRERMINSTQNEHDSIVHIEPLYDHIYNENNWCTQVQDIVGEYTNGKVCLVGHKKDESSYYLDMFPQWDYQEVPEYQPLSATSVRELLFVERVNLEFLSGVLPTPVYNMLADYIESDVYQEVIEERRFQEKYRKQFEHLPYAPTFVTADAVVFCAGHVLMVRRGAYPGKGLLAFPGGFLDAQTDKSVKDCALRELREETRIKVPPAVLESSIVNDRVFDAIKRSARGRTITHAFNIQLKDLQLPKVRGGSDAARAEWIPFAELKSEECFEDHYQIFEYFLGAQV